MRTMHVREARERTAEVMRLLERARVRFAEEDAAPPELDAREHGELLRFLAVASDQLGMLRIP